MMLKIHPIDCIELSKSGPEDIFVKPPSNMEELFVVLHELGHHVDFKRMGDQARMATMADAFVTSLLGIISYRMWDNELAAWVYAFSCTNPKYHPQLFNTAYWSLKTYFDMLADPPPDDVKDIFLRTLRYTGIDVTTLQTAKLTPPYWWATYLSISTKQHETWAKRLGLR